MSEEKIGTFYQLLAHLRGQHESLRAQYEALGVEIKRMERIEEECRPKDNGPLFKVHKLKIQEGWDRYHLIIDDRAIVHINKTEAKNIAGDRFELVNEETWVEV